MENPKLTYSELREYYEIHKQKHGKRAVDYHTFLKRYNTREWSLKDAIWFPSLDHSNRDKYLREEAVYLENFIPNMNYEKHTHRNYQRKGKTITTSNQRKPYEKRLKNDSINTFKELIDFYLQLLW